MTRGRIGATLLLVAGLLVSCAPSASGEGRQELVVFAAASLAEAFREIGADFELANPSSAVRFHFASSSQLRTQLEHGARADVFASADETQMERAAQAGLLAGTARIFARNRLLVAYPDDNPGDVRQLGDLARPGLRLVTAMPEVPIGRYTLRMLDEMARDSAYGPEFRQGVVANIASREPNVRQLLARVMLGEADAGVVYASDARSHREGRLGTLEIPTRFNTVARYPIAPLRGASSPPAAESFIDYVLSARGQALVERWGFAAAPMADGAQPGDESMPYRAEGEESVPTGRGAPISRDAARSTDSSLPSE